MSAPLRIANCSGFFGDRLSAANEMVNDGPIDVLSGDWLAELTMLILARTRAHSPRGGYARTFVTQMEQVMGTCLDRGIKVVSNAGGLDPDRCAEVVAELASTLGLAPRIAYVNGDDLLPRLDELARDGVDFTHFETGEPLGDPRRFISANAYLGCFGIVEALQRGADIVITGRVTDAALACGPAAWHHHWSPDNLDALAGAVVAGHVIECGAQVTGGNYSFFNEVAGMTRVGFPWVEVAEDGSCVVGKHDGTGGEVSIGTVTSQLLYEIGGPSYLGPDVTARFDTIELEQLATDRVRISGVRGEAPPEMLKVAMNEIGGYRKDLSVAITGLDVEEKARLVEDAFWRACPLHPSDFESVTSKLQRTDKIDPATNDEAVATWRLTLKDPDESKLGRAVSDAVVELALATAPGFFIPGATPAPARAYGIYRPALVPRDLVPQYVTVLGDTTSVVASLAPLVAPAPESAPESAPEHAVDDGLNDGVEPPPPRVSTFGPTTKAPLGLIVATRSGDKGANANLGVFARSDGAWIWLDAFLNVAELRRLLPETATLRIERYRFEHLRALNFVIHDLLDGGVAASTRQDAQAKGLGEWLRSRYVDIPRALVP